MGDMLKFKIEIDHFWSYPVAVQIQRYESAAPDGAKEAGLVDACAPTSEASEKVTPRRKSRSPSRERNKKGDKPAKPQPAVVDDDQKVDAEKSSGSVHDIVASLPTPNRTSMQKAELEELNTGDASQSSDADSNVWKRYQKEDGETYWWWCELDNDCFLETNPGPWTRSWIQCPKDIIGGKAKKN